MDHIIRPNLAGVPRPVVIVPYQTEWPLLFEQEATRIRAALGDLLVSLEHIGSTSVPGLAAKPIIDMLAGLRSLDDTPRFAPALINLGYRYFPEHETEMPDRRYFSRILDDNHGYHLHMVEPGTRFYQRHLAFRNYLRGHPETAAEYAALKLELSAKFGSDREGYTAAKTDFIQRVERLATNLDD